MSLSTNRPSFFGGIVNWLPGRASRTAPAQGPHSEAAIHAWLINNVAGTLSVDPEEIDARETFANYGLDSRAAVGLSGDLERWLGLTLPPTLVWDYPTINAMAEFLAAESARAHAPTKASSEAAAEEA